MFHGSGLWVAGNEGMEKRMETTISGLCKETIIPGFLGGNSMMGFIGTTIRIHSFILSKPKARVWSVESSSG